MQKCVQKYVFTFISQYIFSLISSVITNGEQYIKNSNIHGRNARYGSDIHQTISNLSLYQKGYHMGLKVFNSSPTYIKDISCNVKEFKSLLKNFLFSNSLFFMLEEYFQYNDR